MTDMLVKEVEMRNSADSSHSVVHSEIGDPNQHGGRDGKAASATGKFSVDKLVNPMSGDRESFKTASVILQARFPADEEDELENEDDRPMSRESFLQMLDEQEQEEEELQRNGDIGAINTYFNQYRIAEITILKLAVLSWLCGAIAVDIEYERFGRGGVLTDNEDDDEFYAYMFLSISTISTALLFVAIIVRYNLYLRYRKSMGLYANMDTLSTSGLLPWMIFDLVASLVHPIPSSFGSQYDRKNSYNSAEGIYEVNMSLQIAQIFLRLHLCIRALASFSRYAEGRSQRVCNMNGARASSMFIFRSVMKRMPLFLLLFTFSFSIVLCGYCFRVFERPFMESTGQDFENPRTGMWCVILTMTTVGYGDFFPVSDEGRAVGAFACIWGVILVSLMVVTLTNLLELKPGEKKAHRILERLSMRKVLKRKAGLVIGYAAYRHIARKKYGAGSSELRDAQQNYLKILRSFQEETRRARTIFDKNEFEGIERDLVRMQGRSEEITEVFSQLEKSQARAKMQLSDIICKLRAIDSLSRAQSRN